MKKIVVGISCIGSGVGQSVINSCNLSSLPLYTIGFGTNPLAYGLYECDDYAYTKSFYDEGYIDDIINHCLAKDVDIFIPGHDDDAHIVSQNVHKFEENGIKVIVTGEKILDLCRDKEAMSLELNKVADIFVKSFEKEAFIEAFYNNEIDLPVIAKPRAGFASKGIEIILSEEDFSRINDIHIVQELAVPHTNDPQREYFDNQLEKRINPQVAEISIQVVANPNGDVMGKMISYNKLNNGVPIEIIPMESDLVWEEVNKLYPTLKELGLKGPLNLQGRITDKGLKLFEMNARFTGITGLRAYMGFNEVEACIKEWMGIRHNSETLVYNKRKFGIRQTADKSIPLVWNNEVAEFSKKINLGSLKDKKTILITGATGFIGQNLIKELNHEEYTIWAYSRNKEKAQTLFENNVTIYDYEDFVNGKLSMGNIDVLLHLGFARPHCTEVEIAESLAFTHELFTKAVKNQVTSIINISSQSVYGQNEKPLWTEKTPVAPKLTYSQAKYATELLINSLKKFNPHVFVTSIRLAAVSGALPGAVIQDLPSKLVHQILQGEDLTIQGGEQQLEFIDVRDVLSALLALLQTEPKKWDTHYNLGSNILSLKEIAETILEQANKKFGKTATLKIVATNNTPLQFGMDSTLFKTLTNWAPKYTFKETATSILSYYSQK